MSDLKPTKSSYTFSVIYTEGDPLALNGRIINTIGNHRGRIKNVRPLENNVVIFDVETEHEYNKFD